MSEAESVSGPADIPAPETLRSLLECAILAPSGHNTQPWLFRPREDGVDVYADWERALPVLDPEGRELVMSGGAALFHLRVAARHFGQTATAEMLPDPADPDLLARVRLEAGAPPTAEEQRLFHAISSRRTNWLSFEKRPLPPGLTGEVVAAAEAEGAALRVVDASRREPLRALIVEADRRMGSDDEFRREMVQWLGDASQSPGEGMPLYPEDIGGPVGHFGPWNSAVSVGDLVAAHHSRLAEQAAQVVVLFTPGDTPADWLRAGQALDRVLLRASVDGVSASFLSGPVQVGSLRAALRDLLGGDVAHPLTILGLGYAPARARRTPRRSVSDVVISEPPPRSRRAAADAPRGPG